MSRSDPRQSLRPQVGGLEHRAVEAYADETAPRLHDAAKAGAEATRHSGLERELRWDLAHRAQQPDRLEHRRRPAGVHLGVGTRVELVVEQLGDQPVMAT